MKTINVTRRERAINALLEKALRENLILRTADGHEFVLAEIDDFDREVELTRKNEAFMRLLDERGREKATIPLAEARARAGLPPRRRSQNGRSTGSYP